ncbi:MAG TPA: ABC transporter substrate-binding protein [Puia sp.]|jgi:iron complex transport system substrate-binding protein
MIKISRNLFFLVLSVFVLLGAFSCGRGAPKKEAAAAGEAGDAFSSEKAVIRHAHGFTIDYYDHYKLVRILDHDGTKTDTLKYLLVQEGTATPSGYPGAQVITIPVKSLVVMSSMHVALADFAGVADRIRGLGNFAYLSSTVVRNNVKAGKVTQIGLDGNINNELVISMHPGILMSMANPDVGFAKFKTMMDAGVPVMPNSEWLETTPLGRAEWVKLMAALVNKEDFVNKKFDSVEKAYDTLAQLGSRAATHPRVIIGMPFKGSWYMPAGESYMAKFLRDAGAGYKWADTKGIGSVALDFEAVAPEALTADYWLNVGQVDSKKEIAGKDPRYASFKPFKTGALYNNTKQTNDIGANDYWESGAVNPQVVLADIIHILHPELLPNHQLVYYKQLQ